MKAVDIPTLEAALASGASLYDTRPHAPNQIEPPAGAQILSLEAVQAGELPEVPKDHPIYLICERGQMSELVGLYLEAAGFTQVHNVSGGLIAWRQIRSASSRALD